MAEAATTVPVGKGGRTAARIRDVALEMFSRLGFERVMMAGIAAGAGVSQATLHYHFQDKAQLWRAAMLHLSALISVCRPSRFASKASIRMTLLWRSGSAGSVCGMAITMRSI